MRAAREGISYICTRVLRAVWLSLRSGFREHSLIFFQMKLIQKLCSGNTPNVLTNGHPVRGTRVALSFRWGSPLKDIQPGCGVLNTNRFILCIYSYGSTTCKFGLSQAVTLRNTIWRNNISMGTLLFIICTEALHNNPKSLIVWVVILTQNKKMVPSFEE